MQVPILKQRDYLIASIQSALTDADLLRLRDDLVEQVGRYRSQGVIVDVTVLDVMDSFAVRTLSSLAHMIKLRGAETVIVGIQPEVAFAMVQLGLTLSTVATALDLEEGLVYLDARTKRGRPRRRQHGAAGRLLHLGQSRARSARGTPAHGRIRDPYGNRQGDPRHHAEMGTLTEERRAVDRSPYLDWGVSAASLAGQTTSG